MNMSDDWRERARCADREYADIVDDVFFPSGTTEQTEQEINHAKKVCKLCDVIELCAQWSLKNNIDAGIWGGLSEDERRNIRRKIRAKKANNKKLSTSYV
jgi:WhiB family redox-sensing transcriptional regulator